MTKPLAVTVEARPMETTNIHGRPYMSGRRHTVRLGLIRIGSVEETTDVTDMGRAAGFQIGIQATGMGNPRHGYPSAYLGAFRTVAGAVRSIKAAEARWKRAVDPKEYRRWLRAASQSAAP